MCACSSLSHCYRRGRDAACESVGECPENPLPCCLHAEKCVAPEAARFSFRVACSMAPSFPTIFARSLMSIFGMPKRSSSVFSLRASTLLALHGFPVEVWNRKPSVLPSKYSLIWLPSRAEMQIDLNPAAVLGLSSVPFQIDLLTSTN